VSGYPDGHLFLSEDVLHDALHAKQAILQAAGIDGWVSTQMCFDANHIAQWIRAQRAFGLTLPVRLGLPGPIDRTKLLTMGMRVGVGQSLRYLQKNRSGLTKLMTGSNYNPSLMLSLLGDLEALGIEGIHLFTFNQLDVCREWQRANS
jgi:methylenetetrahydrofolate reductase (NADPH)